MALSKEELDKDFALIVEAALKGERAPLSRPFGPLRPDAITALYASGCIEGQIYAVNWRIFKIMTGPHKGKHTAPRPGDMSPPWKVIGKVMRVNGRIVRRKAAPTAPGRALFPCAGKIAP